MTGDTMSLSSSVVVAVPLAPAMKIHFSQESLPADNWLIAAVEPANFGNHSQFACHGKIDGAAVGGAIG